MGAMRYKPLDKVRIKSLDWYNENKDDNHEIKFENGIFTTLKSTFLGQIMTIEEITLEKQYILMEDRYKTLWTDEMFEGLVEEETKPEPKFKVGDKITNGTVTFTILTLASDRYFVEDNFGGYDTLYFKTRDDWKIVEDKSSIDLTVKGEEVKERIEIKIPEGYEYVIESDKIIFTKKKKEYPKTYEECCKVLGIIDNKSIWHGYRSVQLKIFQKLLIRRDAYWKIYGEEMGLGKPWAPDWSIYEHKFCLGTDKDKVIEECVTTGNRILAFPTAEMRDAFYENFKELIEQCKELL